MRGKVKNERPKQDKEKSSLQLVLQTREKELEDLSAGIDNIEELYIDLEITKQQYKEHKERQ